MCAGWTYSGNSFGSALVDLSYIVARVFNSIPSCGLTSLYSRINRLNRPGLDSVQHKGPSCISIDTLYKSGGNIPESFLRGCGVPDTFITFAHSLVGNAIDYYSCFISFTEADDAISERLHNDLQAVGVRCWRWKEDAKWGKTLMRSIDEAVRVYDKLVVICSEQSLNSPAVIREIERALQKEDELARQGKEPEVLFPVRLDDYIFTGWQHMCWQRTWAIFATGMSRRTTGANSTAC